MSASIIAADSRTSSASSPPAVPEGEDVVPGRHDEPAVDGDAARGRVREDEPDLRELQQRHDGLEVVAAGSEPMHPEDGAGRLSLRVDLDAGQDVGH
jgi:hypothetical protein